MSDQTLSDIELEVEYSDFNKRNNKLLDLEKVRRRNKDIFEDDTKTTIPSKIARDQSKSSARKPLEESIETHLNRHA